MTLPPKIRPVLFVCGAALAFLSPRAAHAQTAIATDANAWLDWIRQTPNAPEMMLEALRGDTLQDFLVPSGTVSATAVPIPEPSDWALGLGFAAMGMVLWRRHRGKIFAPAVR